MRGMLAAGAAVLMVSACSTSEGGDVEVAEVDQEAQGPVVADPVDWDIPLTVEGAGGALELIPSGVRYVGTEEISSPTEHDHPSRQVFVVVRFAVATEDDSATVPDGWGWRQDGQEYGPGDGGNASTAPWMGAIPQVHSQTTVLGGEEPTVGYETFDLDGPGGELTFTDASGSMVRWDVPDQDQGEVPELADWLTSQSG